MKRPPPLTDRLLYISCLAGKSPAEELSAVDRERLLRSLHARGWTDTQIAVHTLTTLYTTARIRSRMGLSSNVAQKGAA